MTPFKILRLSEHEIDMEDCSLGGSDEVAHDA